jgi:acyl carrier protein
VIAQIWSEVLGMAPVGIHDGFLPLGGDSITAAQVLARIRDVFHVELPFIGMFDETSTVADIAKDVAKLRALPGTTSQPLIRGYPRDVDIPLSFGQERLWRDGRPKSKRGPACLQAGRICAMDFLR